MKLIDLIDTDQDITISGVTADSRLVKKGFLFAALPGHKEDGSKYVIDAVDHGAVVILAHDKAKLPDLNDNILVVRTDNTRKSFAKIAAKFYKLQPENIVAVTGTSGKTSTVSFAQQLWHLSGIRHCASLGTLGVSGPGIQRYNGLTTPGSESLHAELADLAAVGITHLAMEASSHGLDQYRLDGVHVDVAGYTNLSRDHLDYHKDMDEYFTAKSRLFSELLDVNGKAIINIDDEYAPRLVEICKARGIDTITYGHGKSDMQILKREPKPDGQAIVVSIFGKEHSLTLPLVGDFQVMNALCALGMVLAKDNDADKYVPLLEKLRGVPGRLQLISGHEKGAVYVDYAHKPAALETVLKTLRPHTEGRLICVFGCGGNRDPGKRAIMGRIASELADVVVVTDDNPRYEEAADIRKEILKAAPDATEIGDRAEAIQWGVKHINDGDVLLVAGKGHEQGQIIAETVLPFNDKEEVEKSIHALNRGSA